MKGAHPPRKKKKRARKERKKKKGKKSHYFFQHYWLYENELLDQSMKQVRKKFFQLIQPPKMTSFIKECSKYVMFSEVHNLDMQRPQGSPQ